MAETHLRPKRWLFQRRIEVPSRSGLEPLYRRLGTRLVQRLFAPVYVNFDKLPVTGAAILVCNHVSYLDGVILSAGCPRPIRYVIDEEIYNLPVVHHFMMVNRAIPVLATRGSVEVMLAAIEAGLAEGDLICIFPEGQLTYTGSLSRFKPGIEWIVARAQVPVYPIALRGLWGHPLSRKYIGSWRRWWPRRRKESVVAICGDPIVPNEISAKRLQQEVLRLKYQASSV